MPASLSLLPTPAAVLPLVAVIPPQAGHGSPRMSEADADLELVRRALGRFSLPYITVTPTFSICPTHGYLPGRHEFCPRCDDELIARKQRAALHDETATRAAAA